MTKEEIIAILHNEYQEDLDDLKEMTKQDLQNLLNDYEDHSDLFPNDDEYDGSHSWD